MIWLAVLGAAIIGLLVGYWWGFGQGDMEARIQAYDLMKLAAARKSDAPEWQG